MIRRWWRCGQTHGIREILPALVEAEAILVLIALLSAVSLTALPPAIDVAGQRASLAELVGVFSPRWPQLAPPPRAGGLLTYTSPLDTFASPTVGDRWQSNFNHNVAGLLVLLVASVAILDQTRRVGWARHWPLLFLGLAVFLILYASPEAWPIGHESFWGQLAVPTVLQHRLATLVVILLALFEWRVQVGGLGGTRWRFGFPILAVAGGTLLLTHTHTAFPTREAFLIEISHGLLGLLAVFTGAARWLELRLLPPTGRLGGVVWRICLLVSGLVLLFYHE
jgi:copper resistance protein D